MAWYLKRRKNPNPLRLHAHGPVHWGLFSFCGRQIPWQERFGSFVHRCRTTPLTERIQRFLIVGWSFLVIYLSYKRVQRKKGLSQEEKDLAYSRVHQRSAERSTALAHAWKGWIIKTLCSSSATVLMSPHRSMSRSSAGSRTG